MAQSQRTGLVFGKAPTPNTPSNPLASEEDRPDTGPAFAPSDRESRGAILAGFYGNDQGDYRGGVATAASALASGTGGSGPEAVAARMSVSRQGFANAGFEAQQRQLRNDAAELAQAEQAVETLRKHETISQEDLDRMNALAFADNANAASEQFLQQQEATNAMLGISGLSGGAAASIMAGLESARFNTIVNAQRASEQENFFRKAEADFRDTMAVFGAEMGLAGIKGKDTPTLDVEVSQALLEADLAELGIYMGADAAERKRKSDDKNSLLGGVFGLAGSILGGLF